MAELAEQKARSDTSSVVEAPALPEGLGPRDKAPALRRVAVAASAVWAAFLGLLPHVLHHAGPLAGAALFAGLGGSLLFGALGLIVSIPFLRRMHRRFGTWRAPAIALVVFAAVFSVSAFVIGPKINSEGGSSAGKAAPDVPTQAEHEDHHE